MTHELKPLAKWYLGSMNDGLHIQDRPAIGMNDDGPWDMPDGPNIIADVSKLGNRKAQIICDAHNAAVEAWNTRAEAQPSADVLERAAKILRDRMGPPFGTPESLAQEGFLKRWHERADKNAMGDAQALAAAGLLATKESAE